MKEKYWNPAIERTDRILKLISSNPSKYRMIDLARELGINKSSMYTLLNTLERLNWITKKDGGVYTLGTTIGYIGASYSSQFNILQAFYEEAVKTHRIIDESLQMGILDKGFVVYTGKARGNSLVQLVTQPGMRFPAYASSIGKILLTQYTYEELLELYPEGTLIPKTDKTITSIGVLYKELELARMQGYIEEHGESAEDIHCVAAPVYNHNDEIIAGVSMQMTTHSWDRKKEIAREEVIKLAKRLSQLSGQRVYS